MGAWSHTPFGNDTSADWAYELGESDGLSFIEATLDRVLEAGDDYVEAPDAEKAVAAVEVLARLLNRGTDPGELPEAVSAWLADHPTPPSAALRDKARRVIQRITGENSELAELWDESDSGEWREDMAALQGAMAAA